MALLEELQGLYQAYREQFQQQERARKPLSGVFGLGAGPGDAPCHQQFSQELERLLEDAAARGLPSGEIRQALEFIYRDPQELRGSRENAVYWMLLAAHRLTLPLAAQLDPADAGALYEAYQRDYPRRNRLPAQKEVSAALGERGKSRT